MLLKGSVTDACDIRQSVSYTDALNILKQEETAQVCRREQHVDKM